MAFIFVMPQAIYRRLFTSYFIAKVQSNTIPINLTFSLLLNFLVVQIKSIKPGVTFFCLLNEKDI